MAKIGPRRNEEQLATDMLVGKKLEMRRIILGLSQEQMGEAIGLTFQQVQKYEKGANRVSASRLFDISNVLGVSASYFFEPIGADQSELATSDLKFAGFVAKLDKSARDTLTALIVAIKPKQEPYAEPVPASAIKLSRSGHVTHINGRKIV